MKKRLLTVLTGCLLTAGVSLAFADTTALKVGVVDLPQVMQKSPQISAINQKLQTQFSSQQQKIMTLQGQMRDEAQKIAPNAPQKLSDVERKKVQDHLAQEQKQLQQMVEQFQSSVGSAQGRAMQDILAQVSNTVKGIAENQKLDLVLLKQAVLYSGSTIDITPQVITQMPK